MNESEQLKIIKKVRENNLPPNIGNKSKEIYNCIMEDKEFNMDDIYICVRKELDKREKTKIDGTNIKEKLINLRRLIINEIHEDLKFEIYVNLNFDQEINLKQMLYDNNISKYDKLYYLTQYCNGNAIKKFKGLIQSSPINLNNKKTFIFNDLDEDLNKIDENSVLSQINQLLGNIVTKTSSRPVTARGTVTKTASSSETWFSKLLSLLFRRKSKSESAPASGTAPVTASGTASSPEPVSGTVSKSLIRKILNKSKKSKNFLLKAPANLKSYLKSYFNKKQNKSPNLSNNIELVNFKPSATVGGAKILPENLYDKFILIELLLDLYIFIYGLELINDSELSYKLEYININLNKIGNSDCYDYFIYLYKTKYSTLTNKEEKFIYDVINDIIISIVRISIYFIADCIKDKNKMKDNYEQIYECIDISSIILKQFSYKQFTEGNYTNNSDENKQYSIFSYDINNLAIVKNINPYTKEKNLSLYPRLFDYCIYKILLVVIKGSKYQNYREITVKYLLTCVLHVLQYNQEFVLRILFGFTYQIGDNPIYNDYKYLFLNLYLKLKQYYKMYKIEPNEQVLKYFKLSILIPKAKKLLRDV